MSRKRRRISLFAQFTQKSFGREVCVSLKKVEQWVFDIIHGRYADCLRIIHAFGFHKQFGLHAVVRHEALE